MSGAAEAAVPQKKEPSEETLHPPSAGLRDATVLAALAAAALAEQRHAPGAPLPPLGPMLAHAAIAPFAPCGACDNLAHACGPDRRHVECVAFFARPRPGVPACRRRPAEGFIAAYAIFPDAWEDPLVAYRIQVSTQFS